MLFKNMKNLALSAGVFALILCTFSSAYAQEGSVNSGRSAVSQDTYDSYIDQLSDLKDLLILRAADIGAIITCQASNRLYDDGVCVDVYDPEQDPGKAAHADKAIVDPAVTCAGDNEVRHFDGNVWGCKVLTSIVITPIVPTTYTYSWVEGAWTSCVPSSCGSRTKSVTCTRNDGVVVPSSNCTASRPYSYQPCNIPAGKRYCEEGICVNDGSYGNAVQHCP